MSEDSSKYISDSLEALLASIADGVREAQNSLSSAPPIDAYGRPVPSYHIPYLDFEIQVEMETVTTQSGGIRLRMTTLGGKNTNTQTKELSSTISGRLVAIPPGEGVPIPQLHMLSERISARRHKILVTVTNSAGEVMVGQPVELNINMEASRQLSLVDQVNLTGKRAGTNVEEAILITDENGTAETIFTIDSGLPAKASLVLTAELGTQSAHLALRAGGNS